MTKMRTATIIGLLVVICGLVNSEMKNPVEKLTKRFFACDSTRPALPHGHYWAHDWDATMDFKCPRKNPISSLYSTWRGCKRDRIWSFTCPNDIGGIKTCSYWTDWLNEWDGPLFAACDCNGYISGMQSVHDNGKEDRRFKILCCKSNNFKTVDCEAIKLNDYHNVLNYQLPEGKVLTGLFSQHKNELEDREWLARVCRLAKTGYNHY